MKQDFQSPGGKVVLSDGITGEEALSVVRMRGEALLHLMKTTEELRQAARGNSIRLCAILNARSGSCPEDCVFCAQSAHHRAQCATYPLQQVDNIIEAARCAERAGATCFSIVTSGRLPGTEAELEIIESSIKRLRNETRLALCASLGLASRQQLLRLKKAGLHRYHHNLETARSFFGKICTTHTFEQRLKTVESAKDVGLEVCCGGIFGLGETDAQRVELAFQLKELGLDSIAINFLQPIKGTPLEARAPIVADEALATIAMLRLVMPNIDMIVCGGRQLTLGSSQHLIFRAGASGIITGDLLTTKGQLIEQDIAMIRELGLETATP